jgi:hypothetical protein
VKKEGRRGADPGGPGWRTKSWHVLSRRLRPVFLHGTAARDSDDFLRQRPFFLFMFLGYCLFTDLQGTLGEGLQLW